MRYLLVRGVFLRSAIVGNSPFVSAEAGAHLAVESHRLLEISTAEAILTEAHFSAGVVADGAERAEAAYTISHRGPTKVG